MINKVRVRFHPSEISFYEMDVDIVLALDKVSPVPNVSFDTLPLKVIFILEK